MLSPYTVFRPSGLRPIVSLSLPDYPSGKRRFPFFALYDDEGKPLAWIRAQSGIDRRAGVYFLHDERAGKLYVGSSIAATREANVRRTMVRHFQEWHRPQYSQYVTRFRGRGSRMHQQQDTEGGVLFDRQTTSACVLQI